MGYKTQILLSQISLLPEEDGKATFLFCSYSDALQKRKASFIRIYRIATWGRKREGKKEAVWKVPEDGEPTSSSEQSSDLCGEMDNWTSLFRQGRAKAAI